MNGDEDTKKTSLVADVYTEPIHTLKVLEEDIGYVNMVIIAYKVPDGRVLLAAGPVMSITSSSSPSKTA